MSETVVSKNRLTEGPIVKSLLLYAVPILLSNIFQQLYNTVDAIVVGNFSGDLALAAVGSSGALINLMIGFFLGLATGTGVIFAMYYGAKNYKALRLVMDNSVIIGLVIGVLISIAGVFFSGNLLQLMKTPDTVFPYAQLYLKIYLGGTVANILYNLGAGIIRAEGNSRAPLVYLVIGGLTNVAMDILLVAVLKWGVAGAAMATVASQLVSAILCFIHMSRMDERYGLRLLHLKFDYDTFKELIRVSVPCGLQTAMFNIANFLVQTNINSFGDTVMAAFAAYGRIDGFIYMPTQALSLSLSTFVGQNVGAGRYERARKGVYSILAISMLTAMIVGAIVFFNCGSLMRIFTTEENTIAVALQMSHYFATMAWIFVPSDVLGSAIRGTGKTLGVTIVSATSICVFRLIWLATVVPFFGDVRAVYIVYPVSWVLSSICMSIYFVKIKGVYFAPSVRRDTV